MPVSFWLELGIVGGLRASCRMMMTFPALLVILVAVLWVLATFRAQFRRRFGPAAWPFIIAADAGGKHGDA